MKLCTLALSIFLAGIVTMANNPQLCSEIDPTVCLFVKAVALGLNT